MAKEVRLRRGSENENDAYTGPSGEVTVDTDNWNFRLHDGETEGGHVIARVSELTDTFQELNEKGEADGYASLDGDGKVPEDQLPDITIVNIHSVDDISERDSLSPEQGDISIVQDATDDSSIDYGSATYIYTGSEWKLLKFPEDATAIHGISITSAFPAENSYIQYDGEKFVFKTLADVATSGSYDDLSDKPNEGLKWQVFTSETTIDSMTGVIANTSDGGFTINLPESPSVGDIVAFMDYNNNWSNDDLNVYGNGNTIEGDDNFYADVDGGSFYLIWNDDEWKLRFE